MKKATGIIRRLDDLGRIVIPKEIRRQMGLKEGDAMELYTEEGFVSFRRYLPVCDFCGERQGDTAIGTKNICPVCLSVMKDAWAAAGDSDALECDTDSCAFNSNGACRFSAVHGRSPRITENDGCTEGVIDNAR